MRRIITRIRNVVRCVLSLIRGSDCPISISKEVWDRQYSGGRWDRLQDFSLNTGLIAMLCREYSKNTEVSVLDVGCGNGGLALELKKHLKKFTYCGIDISSSAIDLAYEAFPEGTFKVGDIMGQNNFDKHFDIVIFNEVLYYVDAPHILNEYKHVLKKDGLIVISMYKTLRTRYLWNVLKKYIRYLSEYEIRDINKGLQWGVKVGQYNE